MSSRKQLKYRSKAEHTRHF